MSEAGAGTASSHVWTSARGTRSNDRAAFAEQLSRLGAGWRTTLLGMPLGEPLPLWRRAAVAPAAPRLLVACGFHGEEPAGPWGLVEYLRTASPAELDRVDLALLPLVNATGFSAGTRFNRAGQNPNRGFMSALNDDRPSAEGEVLLAHAALLDALGADGVMSCHEDVGVDAAYVYGYERADAPGAFSRRLRDALAAHFALHPDGAVDERRVADGIVFNAIDGSFEAWLFTRGAGAAACIETPGRAAFDARVAAQAAAIRAFVSG